MLRVTLILLHMTWEEGEDGVVLVLDDLVVPTAEEAGGDAGVDFAVASPGGTIRLRVLAEEEEEQVTV